MEKITKSSDKVLIDPNEPLILPDGTALVGRVEWFLYALCCLDYQNLPTPMSRIEEFANALITGEIPNIQPQSRAEQFFLAILDGNISDLPQPQSRSEVLLDKLARGEFDLSDVEPIQSSYELLLAYLIKNGGIGNIDYVLYEFSEAMKTMYNTVEKPFKSLELSGNTLVNCVLEDTENDDYTSFDKDYSGTSFTINGTNEGAIKSAILKGQTLVNIINSIENATYKFTDYNLSFVDNTKTYYVKFDSSLPVSEIGLLVNVDAWNSNKIDFNSTNGYGILTPNKDAPISGLRVRFDTNGDTTYIPSVNLVCIEYQEGMENWDIPYFTGMQSVKMPVLKTTGKNLLTGLTETPNTNYTFDNGILTTSKHGTWGRYGIEWHLNLKKDVSYYFHCDLISGNYRTNLYKKDGTLVGNDFGTNLSSSYHTVPEDGEYIFVVGSNQNNVEVIISNLQLTTEKTKTSYEPFKSNILTVNEPIELRGIGKVKDELNLLTGEFTERLITKTYDGSENWGIAYSDTDEKLIYFQMNDGDFKNGSSIVAINNLVGKYKNPYADPIYNTMSIIFSNIRIRLGSEINTLELFKDYLSKNNLIITAERSQKSIKTVDLNVVDQNNTKIDKIHVFDEVTHVNTSSDELTPTVNIGKSVSYPTIIKPNTKYTVNLKRNDKPLTVNLGGTEVTFVDGETRKTITTPSTLTNDKLSYYGVGAKCNEIMLIEGEIERNIDYFTGMQSVVMQNQMPILSTVGKNLLDINVFKNQADDYVFPYNKWKMQLKPNTTYTVTSTFTKPNNDTSHYDSYACIINRSEEINYLYHWGINGGYGSDGRRFTTDDTGIIYLAWYRGGCPYDIWDMVEMQIEEGSVATPYEPYKSSILSCNEDVTLRGIGDVKDELDCLTGEMTQRIEEVTFDGSDDEGWNQFDNSAIQEKTCLFSFYGGLPTVPNEYLKALSDKYIIKKGYGTLLDTDEEMVHIYADRAVYFRILKSKLSSPNVIGFKEWLSQNPLTIQYQLATESIKTVDLNVVDQDGNTIPKIKSYNGVTHLEVTVPKQSLLPNVSAEVATDNSKDMSSLTTKHQEISETQSAIQDNIQFQSDEIDTALMATTEIFESILE